MPELRKDSEGFSDLFFGIQETDLLLFSTCEMSSTKRRLSSNSGMLKMCDDENSDDDDLASVGLQEKSIYTFPKKANARRRSSFGGLNSSKSPVNAAEQARITEMYKTVIQMSSENVRPFHH